MIQRVFIEIVIIQSLMQNPQVQFQIMKQANKQSQCRAFFISSLQNMRSQHPQISREIIYLALAIIDKFLGKIGQRKQAFQSIFSKKKCFLFACLWIAVKFQSKSSEFFRQILRTNASQPTLTEVIKAETQILEEIEFQIPITHTYTTMVESFLKLPQRDSRELAAQCLKFYGQVIKISGEYVLCSQLGPIILQFIRTKTIKDPRIRRAYVLIKKQKSYKAQTAHVSQQKCLIV